MNLREVGSTGALVVLEGELPPCPEPVAVAYRTRTGALLRVDGATAGAFDREHAEVVVAPSDAPRAVVLEVERRTLPTNGLPSGPGFGWWLLNRRATQRARASATVSAARLPATGDPLDGPPLWGHAHLDVAWLWTCEETARKAQRTFAIATDLLTRDASFVFAQSQPQLYAFVRDRDPELFARVAAFAAERRFDPDVAAMWVEPDCNLPSGESLLRQMLFARAFCRAHFATDPTIAWLPDTFGFANTLPTLLAHCGIGRFATTKLQWNDTTRFPHAQFAWRGPDGATVTGALLASYEGGVTPDRLAVAAERGEPVVAGYGDGGGGVTARMLADARVRGVWQRPRAWFEALEARRETLPAYEGELYLQYHRGVYTTHRDLKAGNARLERLLGAAEEAVAWCVAVRAPGGIGDDLRARLRDAWEIVLRNQFHDVLPGTSIAAVNDDARVELARAEDVVERARVSALGALPRGPAAREPHRIEPSADGDGFVFENGSMTARVGSDGVLRSCGVAGGAPIAMEANRLALYRDEPAKWEAWNLDADYRRFPLPFVAREAAIVEGALEVRYALGGSAATMRICLRDREPFLRIELAVDWRERRRILRVENVVGIGADTAVFGSPHGTVARSTLSGTPEERATFEVPGQRFAAVRDGARGVALFALDTYGWSAERRGDGVALGHSLLRATTWPDPDADAGEHHLEWAFAPFGTVGTGALERAWEAFALPPRVRLFDCAQHAVAIVACKPAEDGDGVIVRVRECDGAPVSVAMRCGGRMRQVCAVDGLERPAPGEVRIDGESLRFDLSAHALRSFRVRF